MQTSQLPHLWDALIVQSYRQFLLQHPPGVPVLGRTTLNVREKGKKMGATGRMGLRGEGWCDVCMQSPAIFRCCHSDQSQHKWGSWGSDRMAKPCQMVVSKYIVGRVSVKKGFWAVDCNCAVILCFHCPRAAVCTLDIPCGADPYHMWCSRGNMVLLWGISSVMFQLSSLLRTVAIFFCGSICSFLPGQSVQR